LGFGEELRREREKLGISLEALRLETKVNEGHLEELERGEYHKLPGGVFRRGIVRSYLRALNLDEDEWLPRYEKSVADHSQRLGIRDVPDDEAWVRFAANVRKNRSKGQSTSWGKWALIACGFLVLFGSWWAIWHYQLEPLLN